MTHDDYMLMAINALCTSSFITGSYLVDPEKANDIDVVVVYNDDIHDKIKKLGFKRSGREYEKSASSTTLKSVWRNDKYNLIVVKDEIALALWKAFSDVISNDKENYTDKNSRIKLHELITKSYKENTNDA